MNKKLSFQEKLLKITKNQKKKTNKHVLIALPIVIACTFLFTFIGKAQVPTVQKNPENILTASFVGDIMFGRNVEKVTDRYGKEHL
ncbi:capsular biosynthesis protein, partial [Escherichia coli]|nr:capsular biosynthesis protein [Escherichia coli]